jgi:hypothetical protein
MSANETIRVKVRIEKPQPPAMVVVNALIEKPQQPATVVAVVKILK